MNFQMFKLILEKAEEPEIKLATSIGSSKKQESSRKTSISDLLTMPKPLIVWITINWKILKEMGILDHLTCLLRNLYAGQEATVRIGHGTTGKKKVKSLSSVRLFATLWTISYQAPPSMGFSRQEYWSWKPFPSPGYPPNPGIKPRSSALQADALYSEPPGKPWNSRLVPNRKRSMSMLYIVTLLI